MKTSAAVVALISLVGIFPMNNAHADHAYISFGISGPGYGVYGYRTPCSGWDITGYYTQPVYYYPAPTVIYPPAPSYYYRPPRVQTIVINRPICPPQPRVIYYEVSSFRGRRCR